MIVSSGPFAAKIEFAHLTRSDRKATAFLRRPRGRPRRSEPWPVTRPRDRRRLPAHALVLGESPEDLFGEHEGRVAVHASGGESGALRVAVADRRRGVRERLELPLARPERGVQRRPDGCRLRRRDLGRIEAARVLYGPVGVEEGVVAAVAEAETEILEREPERRLADEAPRGVRGGREVARARAVQLPDSAGLIALVDRSDDVRASLDAADFQPRVKLRAQPERVAPVATLEADERVDRERHVEDVLDERAQGQHVLLLRDRPVGKSMPEDFEHRVVVEWNPGLDAERHQLLRLDVGEEEIGSASLVRRDRHRAGNVSGARAGLDFPGWRSKASAGWRIARLLLSLPSVDRRSGARPDSPPRTGAQPGDGAAAFTGRQPPVACNR